MSSVKDAIAQAVDRLADELEALSKQIHANPELGYQEVKACAWLSEFLSKQGFKVEQGVGGVDTAFRATIETGDGPTVAILCEYDALPGIGHACGHNVIATSGAGAGAGERGIRAREELAGSRGAANAFEDLPGLIQVVEDVEPEDDGIRLPVQLLDPV
jgi:hypothetical protein